MKNNFVSFVEKSTKSGKSKSRKTLLLLVAKKIHDEFVVGSLLCSEKFFSGYSGFPLS